MFLKDSEDEDKWKLMWIWDVYKWYKNHEKGNWNYNEEEMQTAERLYWENQVSKQQGKWDKKIDDSKWLDQANLKPKHWEKFKEICLILIVNEKIDENENMNTTGVNQDKLLCSFVDHHKNQLTSYESYKNETNPSLGVMEHLWTISIKPKPSGSS